MGSDDDGVLIRRKLTYRVFLSVYSENHLYKSSMEYDGVVYGDGGVVVG